MYQPRVFREEGLGRLHDLIAAHPFGTLLVVPPGGEAEISHVPFLLDRDAGSQGRLRLHVARANPIWKAALAAGRVTALFAGPHAYVSPRWYEEPTAQVPTWNYAVVHAQGTPREMDTGELAAFVDELVTAYEGDAPDAWRTGLLAPEFRDGLYAQIVGVSVELTKVEGKLKLSQNRSPVDQARVVDALRRRGGAEDVPLAALMAGAPLGGSGH